MDSEQVAQFVVDYGVGVGRYIRATTKAMWVLKNVKTMVGVPQCSIQIVQYVDGGGHLPIQLTEKLTPKQLRVISLLRETFDKSEEIDRGMVKELADVIKNEPHVYSQEEKDTIKKGKEFYLKSKHSHNRAAYNCRLNPLNVEVTCVALLRGPRCDLRLWAICSSPPI